jgi:hypothetical protein
MDLELAKTLYFRELDRRAELDGAPTLRVAVLALLGGVYSYYIQHFQANAGWMSLLFVAGAGGALLFSVLAVAWIIRSYVGYAWAYLPFAQQLEAHFEELAEYHAQFGAEARTAEEMFETQLRQRLIEAATRNASNNNRRSELMVRASFFLSVAVVFSLISGVPLLSEALAATLR